MAPRASSGPRDKKHAKKHGVASLKSRMEAKSRVTPSPKRKAPLGSASRTKAAAPSASKAPIASSAPKAAAPKAAAYSAASSLPATMIRRENLPLVALVGRPNVGKSTLYNRLLRSRKAITDPEPGVTRDPVDAECLIPGYQDKWIRLVDTGGFKLEREGLDDLVVARSLAVIDRADLIVFMVDASQITPEDEEFAALLRPYTERILFVVNKADSPERDPLVWSHVRWGYSPILFISAEHNRNIDDLSTAIAERVDFTGLREVDVERADIRIAIMGKPNTGKSSLLNLMMGEEKSIVSDVPGTTRDVVQGRMTWKGRGILVLDTAGIRRKKKVTDNVEYYSVTRSIAVVERCDIVILMIDAQEGLTEQDKKIAAFAAKEGRGLIFALNKWDTMPDMKNSFEAARDKLRWFFGQMAYAPVLPLSAKHGTGMDKLLNMVISLYAQLNKKVETGKLNKAVSYWVETTPPPAAPSTRFKLRYAVQTHINPQKFVFFVTRPDKVPESYISFLRNQLRKEFTLDKIPLILDLKVSHVDRKKL